MLRRPRGKNKLPPLPADQLPPITAAILFSGTRARTLVVARARVGARVRLSRI